MAAMLDLNREAFSGFIGQEEVTDKRKKRLLYNFFMAAVENQYMMSPGKKQGERSMKPI